MESDDLLKLQRAVKECSDRCLYAAQQWVAELYASLDQSKIPRQPPSAIKESFREEEDVLLVARSYFTSRQLERVSFVLRSCRGPKAIFLAHYARFLSIERRHSTTFVPRIKGQTPSNRTQDLQVLLSSLCSSVGESDSFLLFLQALIHARLSQRAEATAALIESVNINPWNWSAWVELGSCLSDAEEFAGIQHFLPRHPMSHLFSTRFSISLHSPTDEDLHTIIGLLELFPNSIYLLGQKALIYYHQKDWTLAEHIYDDILRQDPYRIEDMDVYSNMLYVMEKRTKLSKLAHDFLALDKDRPEVCSIVGNHYALQGAHEKALKYFRHAIELDKTYLSAWTLMGHEFVEMKNSEAAIEAYRKAVDFDRKDYRAWFGLGQAYELLGMHRYALSYYQRAAALRPYDVRVWQAMAMCYSDLSKPREAIGCLKRALVDNSSNTLIHSKIASLYHALGEPKSASVWERGIISIGRREGKNVAEYAKSCMYLARYHIGRTTAVQASSQNNEARVREKEFENARQYLQMVAESNAEEGALAGDLLRRLDKMNVVDTAS